MPPTRIQLRLFIDLILIVEVGLPVCFKANDPAVICGNGCADAGLSTAAPVSARASSGPPSKKAKGADDRRASSSDESDELADDTAVTPPKAAGIEQLPVLPPKAAGIELLPASPPSGTQRAAASAPQRGQGGEQVPLAPQFAADGAAEVRSSGAEPIVLAVFDCDICTKKSTDRS